MILNDCRAAYEELSKDAFTPLHSKLNIAAAGWGIWKGSATLDVEKKQHHTFKTTF